MAVILLFRLPIISTLLMELKDFKVIVQTTKRMFSPFLSVLFSLYLVIFMFNTFGLLCYSGVITLDNISFIENSTGNGLYYLLNFNDTYSGLLTLFSILVSNNWNATTEMYSTLLGTNLPRLYFSTFFVVSIMVILNIVISFVLEIYTISLEESRSKV